MPFDPNGENASAAVAATRDALKAAYEQGQQDARTEILATLQGTLQKPNEKPGLASVTTAATPRYAGGGDGTRAPRGLLPVVLDKMLAERPGLKIREYENLMPSVDPRVSPRSISNELRRFEGVKYRQDGKHWFPIAATNNGPDTSREEQSDPLSKSSNERNNGHAAALASEP